MKIENIREISEEEISPEIKKYTAKAIAFVLQNNFQCYPVETLLQWSNFAYSLDWFAVTKYLNTPSLKFRFLKPEALVIYENMLTYKKFMHFIPVPVSNEIRKYLRFDEKLKEYNNTFILHIKYILFIERYYPCTIQ